MKNNIEALPQNKLASERNNIKGIEIAKLNPVGIFTDKITGFKIDIQSVKAIKGGIELYARAWNGKGKQFGFGADGTVEIERFIFVNPPVLIEDPNGSIIRTWTDKLTGQTKERRLTENPIEATIQSLAHTIKVSAKKGNIIKGKIGSSTLTVYPDADPETNTVDGAVTRSNAPGTWIALRGGAGTNVYPSVIDYPFWYVAAPATLNEYSDLIRSIFLFDTSALTSSAIISNVVFSLYGTAKVNNVGLSEANATLWVITSTPASNTDLVIGDFQQVGNIKQSDSGITYAAFSITGYNDITFNATGIGNISKTGISKFGCKCGADFSDTQPEWTASTASYVWGYYAEQTGTSQDPKLVITYSLASGGVKFNSNLSMLNVG